MPIDVRFTTTGFGADFGANAVSWDDSEEAYKYDNEKENTRFRRNRKNFKIIHIETKSPWGAGVDEVAFSRKWRYC
jgi:hypothetical protein